MFEALFARGGLSLERLASFCTVAEAGGIAKAAPGDVVRQSQFSRQIRDLEEHFGVPLTRKRGREVALTDAGHRLATLGRQVLGSLLDYQSEQAGAQTEVTLGAGESVLQWIVMPRLESFAREVPTIALSMRNLRTQEVCDRLEAGSLDFGIVRSNAVGAGLKCFVIAIIEFEIVVPRSLRAGRRLKSSVPQWSGLPVAVMEGDGELARATSAFLGFDGGGAEFAVLRCPSLPLVVAAISTGRYAGVVPRGLDAQLPAELYDRIQLPATAKMKRTMSLAWNPRTASIRPSVDRASRAWRTVFSEKKPVGAGR